MLRSSRLFSAEAGLVGLVSHGSGSGAILCVGSADGSLISNSF